MFTKTGLFSFSRHSLAFWSRHFCIGCSVGLMPLWVFRSLFCLYSPFLIIQNTFIWCQMLPGRKHCSKQISQRIRDCSLNGNRRTFTVSLPEPEGGAGELMHAGLPSPGRAVLVQARSSNHGTFQKSSFVFFFFFHSSIEDSNSDFSLSVTPSHRYSKAIY